MKTLYDILEGWVQGVKTKWHPKEGLFTGDDPQYIADYLLKHSKDKGQAMQRLVFYMNRAGEKCPNKTVLNKVKKILSESIPAGSIAESIPAGSISESIPAGSIAESILDTDFDIDDISIALDSVYDIQWRPMGKGKGAYVANAVQILAEALDTIAKIYKKSKLPMCDVIYNISDGALYMLVKNKTYIVCNSYAATSFIRLEHDGANTGAIKRFMKNFRAGRTVEIKVPLVVFEDICDKLELE